MSVSNVTTLIRAAHERTEAACYALLADIFPEDQIHVIHEAPFSQALRRCYELGMEAGRPWTLCLDADILPYGKGLLELLRVAEKAEQSIFEVQGMVYDKLYDVARVGGAHLYRTRYLKQARSLIPGPNEAQRPEATLLERMAKAGYPWEQNAVVVGLHDFEQYYRDIYRKAYVHNQKHTHFVSYFDRLWRRRATEDPDFLIASVAMVLSKLENVKSPIDVRRFPDDISTLLAAMTPPLAEKLPLDSHEFTTADIADIVDEMGAINGYVPMPRAFRRPFSPLWRIVAEDKKATGFLWHRYVIWLAGYLMGRAGAWLQEKVEHR